MDMRNEMTLNSKLCQSEKEIKKISNLSVAVLLFASLNNCYQMIQNAPGKYDK